MLQLNVTSSGIYYLYNYIPIRVFPYYPEEEIDISKKIWDYKNGDAKCIKFLH